MTYWQMSKRLTNSTGFYINLPAGAVAAVLLVLIQIPDLTSKPPFTLSHIRTVIPQLDLLGFALLAPASVMFLLALQFGGNDYPWDSSVIVGLFCGAGLTAILFVIREYRVGAKAMIPGQIVKQKIAMSSAVQVSHKPSLNIKFSIFMQISYTK
jgi:hypothetical protein